MSSSKRGRKKKWDFLEGLDSRTLEEEADKLLELSAKRERKREYSILTRRQITSLRRREQTGLRSEIIPLGQALFTPEDP